MKALSLKQPWACLVASGQKTIETRKWKTGYRGPILICVSRKPDMVACESLRERGIAISMDHFGCAVAIADLVDCRPMTLDDEAAACCPLYPRAQAWVLANIRRLRDPFPVRGKLGLFDVEVEEDLSTL